MFGMKIFFDRIDIKSFLVAVFVLFIPYPTLAAGDAPVYVPTSAWLVGPASLGPVAGDKSVQMPCVVANQFSNGFIFRLSGGGDQLMAMAIDFRQPQFTPRQKYEVEFSVPGQFFQVLSGAAYDRNTLLFSLYKFPEFYKAIKTADIITIKIDSQTVALNMIGLSDGFKRMNQCYNPGQDNQTQKPFAHTSNQNPLIAQDSGLTPMPGDRLSDHSQDGYSPDPEMSVNAVLNEVAPTPPAPGNSGANLIANVRQSQKIAKELSATNPMKQVPEGQQMAGAWTEPKIVRSNNDIIDQGAATSAQTMDGTQDMRWRALKGADLHNILDSWAQGSGVKLMWLPVENFAVQRSISMSGDFKTAAQALLEQFSDLSVRPVGRLYREPGTTRLVLVVEQRAENNE